MTHEEQVTAFEFDIEALIQRYSQEFDLDYPSVIGILQMQVVALCNESREPLEHFDEEDEP